MEEKPSGMNWYIQILLRTEMYLEAQCLLHKLSQPLKNLLHIGITLFDEKASILMIFLDWLLVEYLNVIYPKKNSIFITQFYSVLHNAHNLIYKFIWSSKQSRESTTTLLSKDVISGKFTSKISKCDSPQGAKFV